MDVQALCEIARKGRLESMFGNRSKVALCFRDPRNGHVLRAGAKTADVVVGAAITDEENDLKKITFVCLGNICRSPAAQGIAARWANDRGWSNALKFDSAGTANYQVGKPADVRMRQVAMERGYELNTTAKQLTADLAKESDWLLAMDRENLRDVAQLSRNEVPQLLLLSDFLDERWPKDVPDPYYGGIDGFHYVLDMLEAAMPSFFVRALQEGENRLNYRTDVER